MFKCVKVHLNRGLLNNDYDEFLELIKKEKQWNIDLKREIKFLNKII